MIFQMRNWGQTSISHFLFATNKAIWYNMDEFIVKFEGEK